MRLPTLFCYLISTVGVLATGSSRAQHSVAPTPIFSGVSQENIAAVAPTFTLFDQQFYDNQLFLLGEAHGVQRPQELDFALLKHLNERVGVRTYVAEVDVAKAYYLNEYLRTGQDSTLRLVFRSWVASHAQWGNEAFYQKLQHIRAWNQTLPVSRRIRFIGLDELQDLPLAAEYVRTLIGKRRLPMLLRVQFDSVTTLLRRAAPATVLAGVGQRTEQELIRHEKQYRQQIGAAYDDLALLLRNLTYRQRGLDREAVLYANFAALYYTQGLAQEKLYGMWGLAHVLQSPIQGAYAPLATRIRQSQLPLHNKIASILCVFSGCQMLYPLAAPVANSQPAQFYTITDKFNHDGPLTVLSGIAELKQRTAPGSTTLYKLDAPGAATNRLPIQVRYAAGIPVEQQIQFSAQLPATAYVQYLLLVRDSGPVQPLQPAR